MSNELLDKIYYAIEHGVYAFCRFITNNDVGKTGAHQAGFYLPKDSVPMLFDSPGIKGENKDKYISVKWQDDFNTQSRITYYGSGTRNEYRLTRFGRDFPFFTDEYVGGLLIFIQITDTDYEAFVLNKDDDIDEFLEKYNLSATSLNKIFKTQKPLSQEILQLNIQRYISEWDYFPDTSTMGKISNDIYRSMTPEKNPDKKITDLISIEFELFKALESKVYSDILKTGFQDVEKMIIISNDILNRRKSRAGKALEHHLSTIFTEHSLKFEEQVVTEDNKKPDFLFPGSQEYHNPFFPDDKLVCLAAKTTCKDRWRQILNEADRIERKYLFTLQQGISINQLKEMSHEKVSLIVPKRNLSSFAPEFRPQIMTLNDFIVFVREKQS